MDFEKKTKKLTELILQYRKQGMRKGQALFMAVEKIDPEIARGLNNTVFDPYFNDKVCNAFRARVYAKWGSSAHTAGELDD